MDYKVAYISKIDMGKVWLESILENELFFSIKICGIFTLAKEKTAKVSDLALFEDISKKYKIPVYYVTSINNYSSVQFMRRLEPDLVIVSGWSELLKDELISIPRVGCVGTHLALLPKNRGRAPIPNQILKGETETGITLFYIDPGVDSGDIIEQIRYPISLEDTATTLYQKAIDAGNELYARNLIPILNGTANRTPQVGESSYLPKRTPEMSEMDLSQEIPDIHRFIRALSDPYPNAFIVHGGKRLLFYSPKLTRGGKTLECCVRIEEVESEKSKL